jgi:uncharacterized protein (DUF488 family)
MPQIMTIGHSSLSQADFLGYCHKHGVSTILDIRSHPTSKWQWFRREEMEPAGSWLRDAGVDYVWLPGLGGWAEHHGLDREMVRWASKHDVDLSMYAGGFFPKHHIAKRMEPEQSPGWTNRGMFDYAWYTATGEFQKAASELVSATADGSLGQPALMCTEFVWWKCHRSMVADHLTWRGVQVRHLMPEPPKLHSEVLGNRYARYPAEVIESWGPKAR